MMHDVYDGGHPWLGVPTRSSYSSVAILNYYIGVVIDERRIIDNYSGIPRNSIVHLR